MIGKNKPLGDSLGAFFMPSYYANTRYHADLSAGASATYRVAPEPPR